MANQFDLLKTRRFLPLFVTQFLGAFNDNVFKNALVILITYYAAAQSGIDARILVTAAAGIFILPFFLFSALAGQVADKFEKSKLISIIKFVEILLMLSAALGFYAANVWILLFVLFLMGTQSAFFGPLKYSILPDHLEEKELIGGNGMIEAGTFLAILLGTILGGLLIMTDGGRTAVSVILIVVAVSGFVSSFMIPKAEAPLPDLSVNYNLLQETWEIINQARDQKDVFLSILGISWFWLVGFVFLAQFPVYGSEVIGGNEQVVTLFLTMFSIGIGIGSLGCEKLLKGEVSGTFAPAGALGMSIFIVMLWLVSPAAPAVPVPEEELIGIAAFLATPHGVLILLSMLLVSICGGIYIVPLYAIMQSRCPEEHRSRTIAANNILNAVFMVAASVAVMALLASGMSITDVFLTVGVLNLFASFFITGVVTARQKERGMITPLTERAKDPMLRKCLRWVLQKLYKVEIEGIENYRKAGDRVLIIANHLSFLDAALIAVFLPERPMFAVNTWIAEKWWMKPALFLADCFPLDPTNPMATKALIAELKKDHKCVIFPEGRITVTGSLMKVYEGPGMVADKSDAMVLPIRIEGAQYTPFSRLKGKVRIRWFPKVTLKILDPRKFEVEDDVMGRERRNAIGRKLYDIMTEMMFESSDYEKTLFQALLDARNIHGGKHPVAIDVERQPMTYNALVSKSIVLGGHIAKDTKPGEYVGVLLPNMLGTIATFFGLQMYNRVPAMLNFSVGVKNVVSACKTAELRKILTSRRFIEAGGLEELIAAIEKDTDAEIVYLEDLRAKIGGIAKLKGFLWSLLPEALYNRVNKAKPEDAAVVLFTSGSEGTPKGVVLSHLNIQANRYQLAARVDFGPTDIVFNALPVFHSFGLTAGTLLPLLSGIRTFFYPSPLHYRIVPELVYDSNATILFGTDTFLAGYAKYAHPYDFYAIRYVFAGAEKLKDETRRVWSEKFGVRIFEGYGATETAPALTINTPMHSKPGTVGRLMPGIEYRLEDVPGIEDGGKLVVRGPNVMKGYLLSKDPGVLRPPEDGWYDTGDIVALDEHGFITIKGRAKRFAKIGGEMVSLTAVESEIAKLWPDEQHAVVSIPDPKKGEALVLITSRSDAARDAIVAHMRASGASELGIPKQIITVDTVPLLGTGKVDYVSAQKLAKSA